MAPAQTFFSFALAYVCSGSETHHSPWSLHCGNKWEKWQGICRELALAHALATCSLSWANKMQVQHKLCACAMWDEASSMPPKCGHRASQPHSPLSCDNWVQRLSPYKFGVSQTQRTDRSNWNKNEKKFFYKWAKEVQEQHYPFKPKPNLVAVWELFPATNTLDA